MLPSACDVRALLTENKNVLDIYYRLPDSAWAKYTDLKFFFLYLWNMILENNLLMYYWIKY